MNQIETKQLTDISRRLSTTHKRISHINLCRLADWTRILLLLESFSSSGVSIGTCNQTKIKIIPG